MLQCLTQLRMGCCGPNDTLLNKILESSLVVVVALEGFKENQDMYVRKG